MKELKVQKCINLRGKYVFSVELEELEHVVVGFGDSEDEAWEELQQHFASHMTAMRLDKNDYKLTQTTQDDGSERD